MMGDEFLGLAIHRQFTHSLVFAPLGALLVALFPPFRRAGPFGWVFACALLAWLTHGPLDSCTTYGTELLWPFDPARIAWNNVGIIDPLYTGVLGAGLWASGRLHRSGRVGRGRRVAVVAMIASLGYLGLGVVQRERVRAAAAAAMEARGHRPTELLAAPTPLNNVLWRVVARLEDGGWATGIARAGPSEVDVRLQPRLSDSRPPHADRWIERSRGLAIFEHFTSGWLRWVAPGEDGRWRVVDMRYVGGLTGREDGLWGVWVSERPDGTIEVVRYRGGVRSDPGAFFRALFRGLPSGPS